MAFPDPLSPYLIAEEARMRVEDRLDQIEGAPALARSCVIAGSIAWDDCECGQLVVSIQRIFTTGTFPFESGLAAGAGPGGADQGRCDHPILVIEYAANLLRCSPETGTEHPPPCEELDAAAQLSVLDAWAVRTGVVCCLRDMRQERRITHFLVRSLTFEGPEGLCQGPQMLFSVGMNNRCPCSSEES